MNILYIRRCELTYEDWVEMKRIFQKNALKYNDESIEKYNEKQKEKSSS